MSHQIELAILFARQFKKITGSINRHESDYKEPVWQKILLRRVSFSGRTVLEIDDISA